MGRSYFVTLLACALAAALAGCTGAGGGNTSTGNAAAATPQAPAQPGADAVRAGVSEVKVTAGSSAEAVVTVNIAAGFHANSNDPGDKFLIPTRLEAKEAEGLKPGQPAYPAGVTKKFAFSESPLNVYEGSVQIRLPVAADARATKGRHTLVADLTVQPCSDTECYPPRKINAAIPVLVE